MVAAIPSPDPITTVEGAELMENSEDLRQVLEAIDKAHSQQKSVVIATTFSIPADETFESMTLEFELLPPTFRLADKQKGKKKR